ncbi:potassium transporter 7 [Cocos nucifera]|uniref:Potassium transporter 7 n=1 Tax=Cocos nucifera TaxID=13894 RepID=A0A8K0IRB3_COCNU|nr:potassium transporter 7 [Cocos nucifera]
MDPESGSRPPESRSWKAYRTTLLLAYQSFGVVYGDLSISPIYVYKSTFSGKLRLHEEEAEIFGVLSLVFWTLTLIALCKYIIFVLGADDNGGTFALYSLMCRKTKMGLLGTPQVAHEHLSAYKLEQSSKETRTSLLVKNFFEKHRTSRIGLLLFVLLGTSMVIGDGVLTPAMSVLSAVSGLRIKIPKLNESKHQLLYLNFGFFHVIIFPTFEKPPAPGKITSLMLTANILAFYAFGNIRGQSIRGGKYGRDEDSLILLCKRRAHKIYATLSINQVAFAAVVYPCLVVAYMGEAAYLSKHREDLHSSFYKALPGLAVIIVMFVTTCLMSLIITTVWKRSIFLVLLFVITFGSLELLYFSACLAKVPHGGWFPLIFSLIILLVMSTWHYGTAMKQAFELQNKVCLDRLLSISPSLGLVRVPGVGLVYSNIVTGVPPMFAHFVTNFPAFHRILIFVCLQTLTVPKVPVDERFLIGRIGPPEYRLFRCIVRYGYKDGGRDSHEFENQLLLKVAEYLQQEVGDSLVNGEMSVVGQPSNPVVDAVVGSERTETSKKRVRFKEAVREDVRQEVRELVEEREAGVSYMMGHTCVLAHESSSCIKKFAVNVVYGFLRRNSRRPAVALGMPHTSLIEVGMVYRV